jgi:dihydrofolate reductase
MRPGATLNGGMGNVVVSAAVSLDGFIANESDDPGPLFDWYENGDVAIAPGDPERWFHVSEASAEFLSSTWSTIAAEVIGRRLFDITDGWKGRPATGDHVFVVTHAVPEDWDRPDAPFTFVIDGVESAIAQAKRFAGDRDVALTAGDLCGQALRAGLVDVLNLNVAPVVLGTGVRFFGDYDGGVVQFDDPEIVVGDRVIHLTYRRSQ